MNKALLIGGPGTLSTSCVSELLARNYDVAILNRSEALDKSLSSRITHFRGNRNDQARLEAVIETFKPDVVLDFVCFDPRQAEQAALAVDGRVGQYIFVSTVDVYGYPLAKLPMCENDPWNAPNCRYAAEKRACEEVLLDKAGKGNFALTIARPAYSFGNNFVISFFAHDGGRDLIPRLREGRPVLIPGDGTTLIHAGAATNTGRMIARLAGSTVSAGKSYTCGHHTAITHEMYVRLFASAADVEPNLVYVPTSLIRSIDSPESNDLLLWSVTGFNLLFSMEQFRTDFPDFVWETSLEQAAKEYIEHNDRSGLFQSRRSEILEDRIIAAYEACLREFRV